MSAHSYDNQSPNHSPGASTPRLGQEISSRDVDRNNGLEANIESFKDDVSIKIETEVSSEVGISAKPSTGNVSEPQGIIGSILSRPSYPGFAEIVEMEAVQRLSRSQIYPSDVIEFIKSRDLTKFYEAKQAVEEEQPTTGKAEIAHMPLEELMNRFGLEDVDQGLSESQAVFNREMYGPNVLDMGKKDPLWKIFLSQFKSFVIILLFMAAIASLALRNYVEGVFIIFIVTVNAIMATYMERSAANVLEKLAQLSSPTAAVVRNGVDVEVPSVDVVPGDVLLLKTGDTVVADMRMFEVMEIRINESLLTGESVDIKKTTVAEDLDSPFSTNLCFASTSVVSGFGKGIVVNTGMNTQVGKIASQLKKASETSKITPLQRGLNRLGGTIGIISTIVLISIVIVAVVTKFDDPTRPNTNKTLSIVLLAVGFAASSIPEGLPMVVTISLSLGAKDMARQNANVLKLPAVETLGCCSVVCSDKTGTLTEGKMVATDIVLFYSGSTDGKAGGATDRDDHEKTTEKKGGLGQLIRTSTLSLFGGKEELRENNVSWRKLKFYPTNGFNPTGGVFDPEVLTEQFKEKMIKYYKKGSDFFLVKENLLSNLDLRRNSEGAKGSNTSDEKKYETQESFGNQKSKSEDYSNTNNSNRDNKENKDKEKNRNVSGSGSARDKMDGELVLLNLAVGYLNSYNTKLVLDENGKWSCVGNMTESPLVVAAHKCGLITELFKRYPRVDRLEVPFNSKRKLSVTVHQLSRENYFEELCLQDKGKVYTHVALVKGAPDVLRPFCRYLVNNSVYSGTGSGWYVDYKNLLTYESSVDKSVSSTNRENKEENNNNNKDDTNETKGDSGPQYSGSSTSSDAIMDMNNELSSDSLRVIMLGLVPLTEEDVKFLNTLEDSQYRQEYILFGNKEFEKKTQEPLDTSYQDYEQGDYTDESAAKEARSANSSSSNLREYYLTEKYKDKGKLVLLGVTGSFDPPRPGVKDSIDTCRSAGIRVIMITGDQKATAVAIAKQINLICPKKKSNVEQTNEHDSTNNNNKVKDNTNNTNTENKEENNNNNNKEKETKKENGSQEPVLTGILKNTRDEHGNQSYVNAVPWQPAPGEVEEETGLECSRLHVNNNPNLDYLPDEQIDYITSKYNVFCRAQPEDKVVIVSSLRRKGEITAMTGDGVNDAAALKTADIGISMGMNGTDVAKGASELVLLDDNFCTIVNAVRSGRTIYSNIQKFVSFLLGTNIGEILYLTTSIVIRTLPPVEALQILFLNFLTDGCPAVALSREPPDKDSMKKPPRKPKSPIMTKDWWLFGNLPHTVFEALMVITAILLGLYLCTGVLTLKELHAQCHYVHLKTKSGGNNDLVYFCKSYEYLVNRNYVGWVTNVDYYDPEEKKMVSFLGAAKGRREVLRTDDPELHPTIREKFQEFSLEKLKTKDQEMFEQVELDANGWIKSKDEQVVDSNKKLYGAGPMGYKDIVGRKSKQARTISFITAVWSEMLRAYTVRSWDFFYKVFNRNPWMHVACSLSATVTFALTVIPGLSSILRVVSLAYWQYLLSISLALVTLVLDECTSKVLYHKLRKNTSYA